MSGLTRLKREIAREERAALKNQAAISERLPHLKKAVAGRITTPGSLAAVFASGALLGLQRRRAANKPAREGRLSTLKALAKILRISLPPILTYMARKEATAEETPSKTSE